MPLFLEVWMKIWIVSRKTGVSSQTSNPFAAGINLKPSQAGLLTYLLLTFPAPSQPPVESVAKDTESGVSAYMETRLTAAGTVADFHGIPI